ncbi:MAG TPA: spore protease YyaC [Firmicutes bacterium]|nr:spore protease YyaC [Bacillota bacterium]
MQPTAADETTRTIINPLDEKSSVTFIHTLSTLLNDIPRPASDLLILCIGSDRSTGDSLGPLVGSMLKTYSIRNIIGTLSEPVHALNIEQKIASIEIDYSSPIILAIDASLGQKENIGSVEIGSGTVKPGAAVQKKLPAIGDLYITGIVNVGGYMEFMVLQSTRLNLVIRLARFISWGISQALAKVSWYRPIN